MKRLICCLDGTWDEASDETTLTNVVKLHRAIPPVDPAGVRQLAHYEIGIATSQQGIEQFISGALGLEVGIRTKSAYRFLVDNYEPGDEIYAFGFSRGAFQARSLGGLLCRVGLVRRDGGRDVAGLVDEAWRVYREPPSTAREVDLERLAPHCHRGVAVRCIGVWDTVGNLGIPVPGIRLNELFAFHDTALSPQIDVGLHALAIDEPRSTFAPTLWTLPRGHKLREGQTVEQVWFAGSHANVGGGLTETGLSDIALLWMAERAAMLTGLAVDLDRLRAATRPDPLAEQYSPIHSPGYRIAGVIPYVRLIAQDRRGMSWWRRLLGGWRTSVLPRRELSINESVHDSVRTRFNRPVPLRTESGVRGSTYTPQTVAVRIGRRRRQS